MINSITPLIEERLADYCRAHHVVRLAFWGASLDPDVGRDVDLDVLVEFEAQHAPGYLGFIRLQRELSRVFGGRPVNLRTLREVSIDFRPGSPDEEVILYAA